MPRTLHHGGQKREGRKRFCAPRQSDRGRISHVAVSLQIAVWLGRGERFQPLALSAIIKYKIYKVKQKVIRMAKMGRPRVEGEAITLRLPSEMLTEIDALRRDDPDLPTRQEIVRRAVKDYLEARSGRGD
ncbi:MAG: hypothetical protein CFE34_01810 [Rhodobacteraceae bacterium PARR1]|nr:MAG: hypothetical protein CFE34_01810 [Rhodobacteraceae bacterium PARR1]